MLKASDYDMKEVDKYINGILKEFGPSVSEMAKGISDVNDPEDLKRLCAIIPFQYATKGVSIAVIVAEIFMVVYILSLAYMFFVAAAYLNMFGVLLVAIVYVFSRARVYYEKSRSAMYIWSYMTSLRLVKLTYKEIHRRQERGEKIECYKIQNEIAKRG
jgi:hypothetical protein